MLLWINKSILFHIHHLQHLKTVTLEEGQFSYFCTEMWWMRMTCSDLMVSKTPSLVMSFKMCLEKCNWLKICRKKLCRSIFHLHFFILFGANFRCLVLTLVNRGQTQLNWGADGRAELLQLVSFKAELNHILQFHLIRTVNHVFIILEQ